MQPELLPTPQSDETEEALKNRVERLYRTYGQNWGPFFEQHAERLEEDADPLPWWLIRRARQIASESSTER